MEVVPYLIAEPVQIQMFCGPLYHRQFIDTQEAADHSGDRDAVFLPRNPAGAVECVIFEVQLCQELSGGSQKRSRTCALKRSAEIGRRETPP
ncbi:hypothetical protein LAWASA_4406 [Lawsonibacter asaccharolyticus]|nr:hypothetical protein LAWASA_4406 [Lawsonibacter asaccharolyticus]